MEMNGHPLAAHLFMVALIDAGDYGTRWYHPMRRLSKEFKAGLDSSVVDRLADLIEDRSSRFKVKHTDRRAKAAKIIRERH